MAAWEEQVRANQPDWRVLKLDGGRYLDRRRARTADEGRLDAGAGLRAHQAHGEVHGEAPTCRTITAVRLELLTDPNLPTAARAGRSRGRAR